MAPSADAWEANFKRVKEFYLEHGHVSIPYKGEYRMLAKWLGRQRNRKQLSKEQRDSLDELGYFDETTPHSKHRLDQAWKELFRRLLLFREKNGHCNVPIGYPTDQQLGTWVANQRKLNSQNKLREDRKLELDAIGFEFVLRPSTGNRGTSTSKEYDKQWFEMFQKLQAYKLENGNCNVPYHYPTDPSLGKWVSTQRREYNHKSWYGNDRSIKEERKKELDRIGFSWHYPPLRPESPRDDTKKGDHTKKRLATANKGSGQVTQRISSAGREPIPRKRKSSNVGEEESHKVSDELPFITIV